MVNSAECIHHWQIDVLNYGICKKCGEERQFPAFGDIHVDYVGSKKRSEGMPSSILIKPGRNTMKKAPETSTETEPKRRGRPPKDKELAKVHFDDLPKELQDKITRAPSKNGTRSKNHPRGVKEEKVKAVGGILSILSPHPLTVQRAILKFAIETLETANKRWSNDTARHPAPTKQGES